jgi:hypothetical protein
VTDQEIAEIIKKRRISISKNLVDTSGADFVYSDRTESFKILADALQKRLPAWKKKQTDRNLHPVPMLADGPGSGKSRFLQELPFSFLGFVQQNSSYYKEFKEILQSAVCVNISFSNGTSYSSDEAKAISIKTSVCVRILYQFEKGYSTFESYYQIH